MPLRNLGSRLREAHIASLPPEERVALNFRETRRLNELAPDVAWEDFRRRFQRSVRRVAPTNQGDEALK